MIFEYFSEIDQTVNSPFIISQYACGTNRNYDCETLIKLWKIRNFAAIKNAIDDPRRYKEAMKINAHMYPLTKEIYSHPRLN